MDLTERFAGALVIRDERIMKWRTSEKPGTCLLYISAAYFKLNDVSKSGLKQPRSK